ncbi:hypothetical protein TH53_07215 [Pedobacter lusitanus]|uniref:Uncharacterized protein n=1 Tax=Pedobacter lusitanus TaxID=1503925 RepID=A0A0D0GTC1_9SPHI|nr:hypothetical protein [Pedobacter lusitanus]KIO77721.1 hypothetical protein TH53_07215 [Pedobacter lusitanus]
MKTIKILKLLLNFYLSILLTTFTLFIIGLIAYQFMGVEFLPAIIWFKVITLGVIGYYISSYKKKQFYYYQNLPKTFLWACTFSFDLSLFIALLIMMKN